MVFPTPIRSGGEYRIAARMTLEARRPQADVHVIKSGFVKAERMRKGKTMQTVQLNNQTKQCVECRTDVSNLWRAKDHKRRYFCKTCAQKKCRTMAKSKHCKVCNTDVSRGWRIKDRRGEYLCQDCYLGRSQMPEIDGIPSANESLFQQPQDEKPHKKKTKASSTRSGRVIAICPKPTLPWAGLPFGKREQFKSHH